MTKREFYDWYIATLDWQARRDAALAVAGRKCSRCGSQKRLEVHHRVYVRLGRELPTDLIVECHDCHYARHA